MASKEFGQIQKGIDSYRYEKMREEENKRLLAMKEEERKKAEFLRRISKDKSLLEEFGVKKLFEEIRDNRLVVWDKKEKAHIVENDPVGEGKGNVSISLKFNGYECNYSYDYAPDIRYESITAEVYAEKLLIKGAEDIVVTKENLVQAVIEAIKNPKDN